MQPIINSYSWFTKILALTIDLKWFYTQKWIYKWHHADVILVITLLALELEKNVTTNIFIAKRSFLAVTHFF